MGSLSAQRRGLFTVVAVVAAFLLLEGTASLVFAIREALIGNVSSLEQAHCRYDADLGWSSLPNRHVVDFFGPGKSLSTNAAGFRGTFNYTVEIPAGRHRLQFLGDSFTMGVGVNDSDCYCARLEARYSGLEVINMGLGGYGLDQMYLGYLRDGMKYDTNALIVAVIAPDFDRMTLDRFTGIPKPRLVVEDGRLVTRNVPVPRSWGGGVERRRRLWAFTQSLSLGYMMKQAIWRPELPALSASTGPVPCTDVAALILSSLQDRCPERGQTFVVAYLPTRLTIEQDPDPVASWLTEYCRAHEVPFINLTADFGRLPPWKLAPCFDLTGHYSARGHEMAAAALAAYFAEILPWFPQSAGLDPAAVSSGDGARRQHHNGGTQGLAVAPGGRGHPIPSRDGTDGTPASGHLRRRGPQG